MNVRSWVVRGGAASCALCIVWVGSAACEDQINPSPLVIDYDASFADDVLPTDASADARDASRGVDAGACDPAAAVPVADGGGRCGTMPIGAQVPFTLVDAGEDGELGGGALEPGIYDIVAASRSVQDAGSSTSVAETLVVGPGSRFTRVRKLGDDPAVEQSGTFVTNKNDLILTVTCSGIDGGAGGTETLAYETTGTCTNAVCKLRLGVETVTLKRRAQ